MTRIIHPHTRRIDKIGLTELPAVVTWPTAYQHAVLEGPSPSLPPFDSFIVERVDSPFFLEVHFENHDTFCLGARQLARVRRCSTAHSVSFQLLTNGASIASYAALDAMPTRSQMLRVTRSANGEVVFKVSGQLTAKNVAEMETLFAAERKDRRIVLDCTDLRSVDGEAVKFLEKWEADSIKLKNCGLYIRGWIRRERLERRSKNS